MSLSPRRSSKSTTNGTLKPSGATGGGQIGYNQQIGQWLLGVEADINAIDADTRRVGGRIPTTSIRGFSQAADLSWMATLRARMGLAVDRALIYATGGVALGGWDANMHMTSGGVDAVFHNSSTEGGWVVGGGLEYALSPKWTLKAEYLFADFGQAKGASIFPPPNNPNFIQSHGVDLTTQIARVGVNYQLGPTYLPLK